MTRGGGRPGGGARDWQAGPTDMLKNIFGRRYPPQTGGWLPLGHQGDRTGATEITVVESTGGWVEGTGGVAVSTAASILRLNNKPI